MNHEHQCYLTLPPVPDAFEWTPQSWGAALRCRPLEVVAPHLFTTRQLELSADGIKDLCHVLRVEHVAMTHQVHGRAVVVLRDGTPRPPGRSEADVLVSNAAGMAVAVRAADCVPLLLADRATGAVAAVHAGWRGTAARAATAAVDALVSEFGAHPSDLVVAIGPSIGCCCYDVGPELVDAFSSAGHERYLIDRWFITPGSHGHSRLRLDLPGANRDQLIVAGVDSKNIHSSGLCTAMHLDVLTSYRVEREAAGRIAGVIRSHF